MSDIARVYAPGTEPAKGNQNLSVQYPPGLEKATHGNSNLGHDYKDDRTK